VTFLLALALQAGTGLVSDDQAEFAGPLNAYVSNSAARLATRYHKGIGAPLLYAMVGLHLAAIVTYRVRRGWKLTQPMWTGDKLLAEGAPASRDDARTRWLALGIATICAATVAALVAIVGSGGP
jgi:cytochrome b